MVLPEKELEARAKEIVETFPRRGLSFCAAESCTGGLIASSIVAVPDASSSFKGSAVCYCDSSKISVLGVSRKTLENSFAESCECAVEMAEGALRVFGADIAVAATGFLDSNTPENKKHLARTVFLCAALKGGVFPLFEKFTLSEGDDRNFNRKYVAMRALKLILNAVK